MQKTCVPSRHMDKKPKPNPQKLLDQWMEWERGETPPGRVISNLKSRLSGSSSSYKTEAYGSVKQTIGPKDTRVIIPSMSQKEKQFNLTKS